MGISFASLALSIVALVLSWQNNQRQNDQAALNQNVSVLLQLDTLFNSPTMRKHRRKAAKALLAGNLNNPPPDFDDVLGFFEIVGTLSRKHAINDELVWDSWYYWIDGYWHAGAQYIADQRKDNSDYYQETSDLVSRLEQIDKAHHHGHVIANDEPSKDFLAGEAELSD